jgi:decaprenyl-phosphate phosphoribosyltransferase
MMLRVLRPKHWIKNTIVLLGMLVAWNYHHNAPVSVFHAAAVMFSMVTVSSANYLINDLYDREFDLRHRKKKQRDIAQEKFNPRFVIVGLLFITTMLVVAFWSPAMSMVVALFFSGMLYNIPPIRAKDTPFLDVMVESLNNPIRFMAGWFLVTTTFPPSLFPYLTWVYSNFLMTGKRYAEYHYLGREEAVDYRKVFKTYDGGRLSGTMGVYLGLVTCGIYLINPSMKSLLVAGLFLIQMLWYFLLCNLDPETMQAPTEIYKKPLFAAYSVFITAASLVMLLT